MKWFWIIMAVLYVISRFDLIPDMIPLYGWIDDIAVMVFLFRYLNRLRAQQSGGQQEQQGRQSETAGAGNRAQDQETGHSGPTRANRTKSPHEILGLAPNANETEIRAAYRRLANQYHPDKVAHLGKEFQELAEARFKEIQKAYERLITAAKR